MWNKENRFTGWTDVGLSERGVQEAVKAGCTLLQEGYVFDVAYTSVLKRAIKTLWLVLEEMDLMWIPVYWSWRLNERHYGALQGLSKSAELIVVQYPALFQLIFLRVDQAVPLAEEDSRGATFSYRFTTGYSQP